MEKIECTPHSLDDVKNNQDYEFHYFTVRNGKAKYHLLHLPDKSRASLYYALRATDQGLVGQRAIQPGTKLICHVTKKQ